MTPREFDALFRRHLQFHGVKPEAPKQASLTDPQKVTLNAARKIVGSY